MRDGGRSSQATHGPSDQNVAARGTSRHHSGGLGFMRQHEPGEVGADPRENPSRKTAAADAETNLGRVSWLLKKPAERLAGCEKQRGCRSTASAQSSGLSRNAQRGHPACVEPSGAEKKHFRVKRPTAPRNRGQASQNVQRRSAPITPKRQFHIYTMSCAVTRRTQALKYHAPRNEYP